MENTFKKLTYIFCLVSLSSALIMVLNKIPHVQAMENFPIEKLHLGLSDPLPDLECVPAIRCKVDLKYPYPKP